MTNEIKEILDKFKDYNLSTRETKLLLDYIANLQEGNKDLYNKLSKLLGRMSKVINYINDRIEDINNGGNEKEYKSIIHIKKFIEKGE